MVLRTVVSVADDSSLLFILVDVESRKPYTHYGHNAPTPKHTHDIGAFILNLSYLMAA